MALLFFCMVMGQRDYIYWVLLCTGGEQFNEPRPGMREKQFLKRSYQQWALEEVTNRIRNSRYLPEPTLKAMRRELESGKAVGENAVRSRMELIEMIDWALDIINALKGAEK